MKHFTLINIILLLAMFSITACSSSPAPKPKKDPWNSSDSQRSRAHQTQGELSKDTKK